MTNPDYVGTGFILTRLFVSRPTIYEMIKRGELPAPDLTLQSGRKYWKRDRALAAIRAILGTEVEQ